MSCLYRIKQGMDDYTATERRIAEYILDNKEDVISSSAQKLAKDISTSAAAIVRFSKTIGYEGFTHLKVELAKDRSEDEEDFDSIITDSDNMSVLIKKMEYENMATFKNTYKLLNVAELESAIERAQGANKIYLFGIGGSGIVCEDLHQKFTRINIDSVYHHDFHLQMSALTHAKKGDVSIACSYSGETKEIITAQRIAQSKGITTISITQLGKTSLAKHSDYIFNVPKEEAELRLGSISSRFSMFALSDLIYLGLARETAVDIREKIINTRETIKELQ